jgi:hypothetical protein
MTQSASSSFVFAGPGVPVALQNHLLDTGSLTVNYTVAGSPATLSIVVEGIILADGGSVAVLDTYSTAASVSNRSISLNSVSYDWFKITASWTGGSNVAISGSMQSSGSGPTFSAAQNLVSVHTQ